MSKPATSDNSSAVGLFPFLAVLLCTMGALLVLLVILAQRIGVDPLTAVVTQRDKAELPKEPAADPNEVVRLEAELSMIQTYQQQLDELEDQGQERLKDEQKRLSHLEDHIRRMEHELAKLSLAVEQLKATEENQAVDQEQAERELARLQELIKDTEAQLEDMREMASSEHSYAVIPFKGKNGTHAQPIYIVCDENGISLQPEGLQFQPADFIDPKWPGNPLAASLRASREYLKEKARRAGEQEPLDPYPLIIVRPSGIKYYRIAREAISSWDATFGYEFIDADWKLTYPELPEPKLAEVQQHAAMIARERLARLAMAAPSKFRGMAGMGSGTAGGMGSGAFAGWGSSSGRYGNPGGDAFAGLPEEGQGGDKSGSGSADEAAIRYGSTSGSGDGEQAFSSIGPYGGEPIASGPGGSGGNSTTSGDQLAVGGTGAQSGEYGDSGQGGAPESQYARSAQGMASNGTGGTAQPGQVNAIAGAAEVVGGQAGGQSGSAASSSGSSTSSSQGAPGCTACANSAQADAQPSVPTYTFTRQQSIADARGSDWAIKQAMNNAVPIRRPIQVVVRQNQIALLPSRHAKRGANATGTVISLDQSLKQISEEIAGALRERIEEWGLAGNGLYWHPVLELHVGPEAEQTAERLVRLLKNSGVDIRLPETANSQRGSGTNESR